MSERASDVAGVRRRRRRRRGCRCRRRCSSLDSHHRRRFLRLLYIIAEYFSRFPFLSFSGEASSFIVGDL